MSFGPFESNLILLISKGSQAGQVWRTLGSPQLSYKQILFKFNQSPKGNRRSSCTEELEAS